jgi:trimeric autotransporter adhesin
MEIEKKCKERKHSYRKILKCLFLLLFYFIFSLISYSQGVSVNTTGQPADNSVLLDVSSTSHGMLIPRMTMSQRNQLIGSDGMAGHPPATGCLIYQTDNNPGFYYYNGSAWIQAIGPVGPTGVTGVAGLNGMNGVTGPTGPAGPSGGGSGNCWSLIGNSGTVDGINFIGTTDRTPFNVRVSNSPAGRIDVSNNNAFWGGGAGGSISTGYMNTAVGSNALSINSTGWDNTAVGFQALSTNNGVNNTAVGWAALTFNKTGQDNTAVGWAALESSNAYGNTAIGHDALFANTSGSDNTACGNDALFSSNGAKNTACGAMAGSINKTGSNNTYIGYNANSSEDLSNITAIGSGAKVTSSNTIVLGNSSVTSIGGYADWFNISDKRLKENIKYKDALGLDFIMKLKTAAFTYINDENKMRRDGLIAQDVQQALKELNLEFSGLMIENDKSGTMKISYESFVIPLINATQKLKRENDELKALNSSLNSKYELQQHQLETQQAEIDNIKYKLGLEN